MTDEIEKVYPPEFDPALHPNLRVLKNGAVFDNDRNRIVYGKYITTKITNENALSMREKQREMKKAAFEKGFEDEIRSITPGLIGRAGLDKDYLEVVGAKTAQILVGAENARGYAEVLNASLKALGMTDEGKEPSSTVAGALDNLPAGYILTIAKLARGEVIDGEMRDIEQAAITDYVQSESEE